MPRVLPVRVALATAGVTLVAASALAGTRVKIIAAGDFHTCVVTTAGGLKCWGENHTGQLGDGTGTDRTTPTDVTGLGSGVAGVAGGGSHVGAHTCVVTTGGGVKCWGRGDSGQLGDGTKIWRTTPTDVPSLTTGVVAVAAGAAHTCAVTTGGGVKCWGLNSSGQLGDGTTTNRMTPTDVPGLASGVAAVEAGWYHTCAVMTGGGTKCWGSNYNGELGDGTTTDRTTPADVLGLTDGTAAVATGDSHTCAVTTGGGVKCWGDNFYGQLGDGTTTDRTTPTDVPGLASGVAAVAAGQSYTCAVTAGGGVKCWGRGTDGLLGDGTMTNRATPTDVAGLTSGVAAVAAGDYHACALTTAGGVRCWGSNPSGQVGDGTAAWRATPVDVTGLTSGMSAVAAGGGHTCAVTTGGGVKCWGSNYSGQLGNGTAATSPTPSDATGLVGDVAAVSAGGHTCALTTGGGVKCWGGNFYGQLGDGTTTNRATPTNVTGLTSGVAAVAAGSYHTCAVTAEGAVKCWGRNNYGQLGDGTTLNRRTPTDVPWLTSGVAAVATGSLHTCAVMTQGGLKCWGQNGLGQVGDGTTTDRTTPTDVTRLASGMAAVVAGGSHTCALTTSGGVKCWGRNASGELGDGTFNGQTMPTDVTGLASGVATVAAGDFHTCAVTTGGAVKCWGANWDGYGQLGDGTTTTRTTPTDVTGLTSGVVAVAAGTYHTCAVTMGGGVKCWGDGEVGQLGADAFGPRPTPVRTRGFGQSDFDWDDRADVAVYRPSTGTWFSLDSSTANTTLRYRGWGVQALGDVPVPGDYDGDGIIDPTVYRAQFGTWFVLRSSGRYTQYGAYGWGSATDTLVPGDYDGDGATDMAVYRPSTAEWFVLPSSSGFASGWAPVTFGDPAKGDVPIAGDFDGDGRRDPAVYRPSTGTWFWLKSSTNYAAYDYRGWGVQAQGDTPVPGDYDGDGKADPTVYRPQYGTWFVLTSSSAYTQYAAYGWGAASDTLVPADYDGDGRTDAAIYRPATGEWWVRPSGGALPWSVVFGQGADVPLVVP